jgi:hypothetical protein
VNAATCAKSSRMHVLLCMLTVQIACIHLHLVVAKRQHVHTAVIVVVCCAHAMTWLNQLISQLGFHIRPAAHSVMLSFGSSSSHLKGWAITMRLFVPSCAPMQATQNTATLQAQADRNTQTLQAQVSRCCAALCC